MNWSLVTGLLFQVPGSRFQVLAACGLWPVACSLWPVACSLWLAACGLSYAWLMGFFTYGWMRRKESSVVGRQSIVVGQQSAVGGRRLAVEGQRSEVGGRRSSVVGRQSSEFNLQPLVTVIVSARDEGKNIRNLLQDLVLQDYPPELIEIIIVDDHSVDRTAEIVNEFILKEKAGRFRLLRFDDPGVSGKKAAIDFGIENASGEIILTTDADCRLGKSWVSAMIAAFREDTRMVFGPVSYFEERGFVAKFQAMEFLGLVASGAGAAIAGHPFMCNGASLAYRRDAFEKVNGFAGNEKYISGDDVFLLHKMKKEFGKGAVVFCKDEKAIVKTYPVQGLRKFISQRIRWASKSKGYKDPLSIITAVVVFSYSLTVLLSLIAACFNPRVLPLFIALLILKIIADLPLMLGITRFTGQRSLMRWYLPFQVVYPAYVVLAGMFSFFGRKKW